MNLDPMDLPPADDGDPKDTPRKVINTVMERYEHLRAAASKLLTEQAEEQTPDYALIRQVVDHRPTMNYLSMHSVAVYLDIDYLHAMQQIRRSTEAALDVADLLAEAAWQADQEREGK